MRFASCTFAWIVGIGVASAQGPDETEPQSLCGTVLNQRQESGKLIPQRDFQALGRLLAQWSTREGEDVVLAQLIVDWPGAIDFPMVSRFDKFLRSFSLRTIPEYTAMRALPEGRIRQIQVVLGTKTSLKNFLSADYSKVVSPTVQLYLDPITIGGSPNDSLRILYSLQLDHQLGRQVLGLLDNAPEPAASPEEAVTIFMDEKRGSFKEFAARFAYFPQPGMGRALFARLAKYLPRDRRSDFWKIIADLEIKRTATTMALRGYERPAHDFLVGLLAFANFYTSENKNTTINPESVFLRGEVTALFDAAGLPDKVTDLDPEKERAPRGH